MNVIRMILEQAADIQHNPGAAYCLAMACEVAAVALMAVAAKVLGFRLII